MGKQKQAKPEIPIGFTLFSMPSSSQKASSTLNFASLEFSSLPANIQVILKKTLKKDKLTRIKALDELFRTIDEKSVVEMLPVWEIAFNRLILDISLQVRINALKVHQKVVQYSGKKISKIIKKIIAHWLFGFFDTNRDVSNLVRISHQSRKIFEEAFPNRAKVLTFCQTEILEEVTFSLLELNAANVIDGRICDEEEKSQKIENQIAAAINTLGLITELIPADEQLDSCPKLFESKKLWAYGRHKSSSIRIAFYSFVKQLALYDKPFVDRNSRLFEDFLHLAFLESSPGALNSSIETVLIVTKYYPSFWKEHSDLFTFLSNGCYGSRVCYSCLLPLLGNISIDLEFAEKFSQCFWKGCFSVEKNNSSLYLGSYYECISFMTQKLLIGPGLVFLPVEKAILGLSGRIESKEIYKFFAGALKTIDLSNQQMKDFVEVHYVILTNDGVSMTAVFELFSALNLASAGSAAIGNYTKELYDRVCRTLAFAGKWENLARLFPIPGLDLDNETITSLLQYFSTADLESRNVRMLLLNTLRGISGDTLTFACKELWFNWSKFCVLKDQKLELILEGLKIATPTAIFTGNTIIDDIAISILNGKDRSDTEVQLLCSYLKVNLTCFESCAVKIAEELIAMVAVPELYSTKILEKYLIENALFAVKVYKFCLSQGLIIPGVEENILNLYIMSVCHPIKVLDPEEGNPGYYTAFNLFDELLDESNAALVLLPKVVRSKESTLLSFVSKLMMVLSDCKQFATIEDLKNIVFSFNNSLEDQAKLTFSTNLKNSLAKRNSLLDSYQRDIDFFVMTREFMDIVPPRNVDEIYDRAGLGVAARTHYFALRLVNEIGFWSQDNIILLQLLRFFVTSQPYEFCPGIFDAGKARNFLENYGIELEKALAYYTRSAQLVTDIKNPSSLLGMAFVSGTKSCMEAVLLSSFCAQRFKAIDLNIDEIYQCLSFHEFSTIVMGSIVHCPKLPAVLKIISALSDRLLQSSSTKSLEENDELRMYFYVYAQFLYGVFEDLDPLPGDLNLSIFRWIRTLYDSRVAGNTDQQTKISMVDCCSAIILASHTLNAHISANGVPVNTARFLVELCVFWFKLLIREPEDEFFSLLLLQNLKLWEILVRSAEDEADTWVRVRDVQDKMNALIIELFMKIGSPKISKSFLVTKTREFVAGYVGEMNTGSFWRISKEKESKLLDLLCIPSERVQKTTYYVYHSFLIKRSKEDSVALDLKLYEHNRDISLSLPILQRIAKLQGGVNFLFSFEYCLLWMLVLDHFREAVPHINCRISN